MNITPPETLQLLLYGELPVCAVTARLYESELDKSQNAGLLQNGM